MPTRTLFLAGKCKSPSNLFVGSHHSPFSPYVNLKLMSQHLTTHKLLTEMPPSIQMPPVLPSPKLPTGPWTMDACKTIRLPFGSLSNFSRVKPSRLWVWVFLYHLGSRNGKHQELQQLSGQSLASLNEDLMALHLLLERSKGDAGWCQKKRCFPRSPGEKKTALPFLGCRFHCSL